MTTTDNQMNDYLARLRAAHRDNGVSDAATEEDKIQKGL